MFKLAADPHDITTHVVVDEDDPALNNYRQIVGSRNENFIINAGVSTSKINAINRPLPAIDWNVLVNMSDDMIFTVFGWDRLIKDCVRQNCENTPGFLHFPEKDSGFSIAPMSIITKPYYDLDGYIYHPSYYSLWCDNEALEVAKLRGFYYYTGIILYQHLNPAYGHLERDELFDTQQRLWGVDEENFYERKAKNFDLNIIKDPYE